MTKTIRNRLIGAAGLIAAATATPALAVNFMGENFSCEAAGDELARIFEANKVPESAGLIPMLEHLIWMLRSAIGSLDASCQGVSGYAQQRAELVNSLSSAQQACNQMSSSGSCSARQYRGY